jgi:hypothetical protein
VPAADAGHVILLGKQIPSLLGNSLDQHVADGDQTLTCFTTDKNIETVQRTDHLFPNYW